MRKNRKMRVLISSIVMFLLMVALAGVTVAYWASGFIVPEPVEEDTTTEIGEGIEVTTTLNVTVDGGLETGEQLVPVGRESEVDGNKSEVVFEFPVIWKEASDEESAEGAVATLAVETNLTLGENEDDVDLFTVAISKPETLLYGEEATVTVTITFTEEPSGVDQYERVAKGNLVLEIVFSITEIYPKNA